jgi:Raf kinase inhibitor-like YbhB/YbcL family protein
MAFSLTSTAFKNEGMIPNQYTCDGSDISPPLAWNRAPEGTKSFALICDDPDAPVGNWVHWVIYNIPANSKELKEKMAASERLPDNTKNGVNSWGRFGYNGPCPPSGTHRYFFTLYALDTMLSLNGKISKERLLVATKGHIIAQAVLMGKYTRQK